MNKPSVGDYVHYEPDHYKEMGMFENGIVKEVREDVDDAVWVVYNCGGEWLRYKEFTAAKTYLSDLKKWWRD